MSENFPTNEDEINDESVSPCLDFNQNRILLLNFALELNNLIKESIDLGTDTTDLIKAFNETTINYKDSCFVIKDYHKKIINQFDLYCNDCNITAESSDVHVNCHCCNELTSDKVWFDNNFFCSYCINIYKQTYQKQQNNQNKNNQNKNNRNNYRRNYRKRNNYRNNYRKNKE